MSYVLVAGNLSEGFRFIGPFPDFDSAADFSADGQTWVASLETAPVYAAAPELLAAARLANQELIDLGVGSSGSPALRALWAAIAKAEGRGE